MDDTSKLLPSMVRNGTDRPVYADGNEQANQIHDVYSRPVDALLQHTFWLFTNEPARIPCIPEWVLDLIEEGNEILVLAQLNYWFRLDDGGQLRAQIEQDGHRWVAKTYADLGLEVRRGERQMQKAVRTLKKKGFIIVMRCRSRFYGGRVVTHFRLAWDVIGTAWAAVDQKNVRGHAADKRGTL